MDVLLKAEGIAKQFTRNRGESNVFYPVQETDFSLHAGEMAVLSGRSGSGKTTLLNMLCGILAPTQGEVFLEGKNLYEGSDQDLSLLRNRAIGYVPQGQTAIFSLNVIENVLLPVTLYNKDKAFYQEKLELAKSLLEQLQIADLSQVMPSELSGGELRRMAIARALIMNPQVIFADEPTADLDDCNTKIVLTVLKKLSSSGKGLVIATHDEEVIALADSAYEMKAGILKQYGGLERE